MDVYRAVFSLRREVFTNRPIPNDAGKTSPEDEQWFQTQCNAICVTLMFLTCVLDPALPEENGNIHVQSVCIIHIIIIMTQLKGMRAKLQLPSCILPSCI